MRIAQRVIVLGLILSTIFVGGSVSAPVSWAPPSAPDGVTPLSLSSSVTLSWAPVSGASSYTVLRGSSPASLTATVATGVTGTTYSDTTVANSTTYYYAVRAVSGAGTSPNSLVAKALPRTRTCNAANAIVRENCFPGDTGWKTTNATSAANNGIEGFATATSIPAGGTVDLKVNTKDAAPYHVDIYRSGWYGGAQGRYIGSLSSRQGVAQPDCTTTATLGLVDCANWSVTSTLTTTTGWTSGVYLLRLVREDNGAANEILLTVRDDSRTAPILFDVPVTTYQAYNDYGAWSLYNWNSFGGTTVSGAARAVKVSFDRPYTQPNTGQHDWYTRSDVQLVSWLERQGYDLNYADALDLHAGRARLPGRQLIISAAHNEYVSAEMRSALKAARDAGTNIASFGANTDYQKIRFEPSPTTGAADRTQVTYKSAESGGPDPSGTSTTTWRDPAGPNQPENALFGGQYVGDNAGTTFPLYVTSTQGKHRVWRYTSLPTMTTDRSQIGFHLVGWEWDRRVSNGQEPAGTTALTSSPVNGNILQDAGGVYASGPEVQETTIYKAASGASVFNAATDNWDRALGNDVAGTNDSDSIIQQATANVLADMGLRAATPAGVTVDAAGALAISSRTPASGATGVAISTPIDVVFDRVLDPATVSASQMTVKAPGGATVAGTVTYDDTLQRLRFTPAGDLNGNSTYTVTIGTGLKGYNAQGLSSAAVYSFTTGAGTPPTVTAKTPAAGATVVPVDTNVTAVFSRSLLASSVTTSTVTLASAGGAVTATVAYDDPSRTVTLTPSAPLAANTTYTATLTTGIKAADNTPLAANVTWTFTTADPLTVTSRAPAPLASGISTNTDVRAVLNKSADATTITASTFTLKNGSTPVAASVSYDAATRTARLLPSAPLSAAVTYTASLASTVKAADGSSLTGGSTWSFTTSLSATPAPSVTATSPVGGATAVGVTGPVTATFAAALDPGTVTAQTFTLTTQGGTPVAGAVSYDSATRTVSLTPSANLSVGATYVARATTGLRSAVGEPLAADVSWSFTTAGCPCSLSTGRVPDEVGKPVSDGATGQPPYALEVGMKVAVDQTTKVTDLRYYRSPGETGTHVGHIWTAGGASIAAVTFTGETASGWQQQALDTPVTLLAGRTYTVSVGLNTNYVVSRNALATSRSAGPIHSVADGHNGVFGRTLGAQPTEDYANSDYFVDVVAGPGAGPASAPAVSSQLPVDGSTGVSRSTTVRATFSVPLDPATVTSSSFTLRPIGGAAVPATVTYDETTRTAKLTPTGPLDLSTAYRATVSTAITSYDGTPMAADATWDFTVTDGAGPQVSALSPTDGTSGASGSTDVRATFNQALDPTTVTSSTFTVTAGGTPVAGAVSYDAASRTAIFTPSAALPASSTIVATLGTGIASSGGTALPAPVTWSFTTSPCPCQLFSNSAVPQADGRPVQDGRGGAGPFSYEMGVKIQVSQPTQLTAIRFYKSPGETGTHTGHVWTSTGTLIASATFGSETAWGWQQQALATPIALTPNTTYVVSVGLNNYYVITTSGMAQQITNGPLSSVADGQNDVFGSQAGVFPTDSWSSGNYFIDAVVR